MSPEWDVLDQLLGGELSLYVVSQVFKDNERRNRSILIMLKDGEISLLEGLAAVPAWRWATIIADDASWVIDTSFALGLTPQGSKRVV
jgi:hypothetical protein